MSEVRMREAGNAESPRGPTRLIRIRTDDWPARERAAMFRDLHGHDRVRVEPARGEPLRIDATIVRVPELALVWAHRSPLRSDFADGNDRLVINLGGPAVATQCGREMSLERGDAIALAGSDRGSFTTSRAGRLITLEFPHGALIPLLRDPQHASARQIARHSLALRLLRGYVHAAHATASIEVGGLPQLAITHMYDLAAMALGAAREAAEIANGRGVRAARLRAIKSDILARADRELSVEALAARHGVSARYVRMLFESDGTSVTDFVREERLKRAHAMLLSPRFAALKIAEVAFRVGFNDLSYFNRTFRRRFGRTPREVRERG
jgi:AraC-like DNA-binding protein